MLPSITSKKEKKTSSDNTFSAMDQNSLEQRKNAKNHNLLITEKNSHHSPAPLTQ